MFSILNRSCRRLTSRLLLLVLLFAQFALAAQACAGSEDRFQALHVQQPVDVVLDAEPMPACHHHEEAPAVQTEAPMPANLCVAHCTFGDQSSDTFQVGVADAPALPVLSLPPLVGTDIPAQRWLDAPAVAVFPPIPILFGAFRS